MLLYKEGKTGTVSRSCNGSTTSVMPTAVKICKFTPVETTSFESFDTYADTIYFNQNRWVLQPAICPLVAAGIGGQMAGWYAHLFWVSFIVEEDVSLDPIDVGASGAD